MRRIIWTWIIASLVAVTGLMVIPQAFASTPGTPPSAEAPSDSTGIAPEEVDLQPHLVAVVRGKGKWDDAEAILDASFKSIYAALVRQNIHATGIPMVEYLDSDDSTFSFKAMVPVTASAGIDLGADIVLGDGPSGRALKFVHRGSFDDLEQVYNRIDDYLASKNLTMQHVVEEYATDQAVTAPNNMVINIYIFTE